MNHGRPQPLQYTVNAAFLATLFSDYLKAADTPGWYCGPNFYSIDVLRKFAETQVRDVIPPLFNSDKILNTLYRFPFVFLTS